MKKDYLNSKIKEGLIDVDNTRFSWRDNIDILLENSLIYIKDGELYTSKWIAQAREMIGSQMARMNYMLNYYLKNYAK